MRPTLTALLLLASVPAWAQSPVAPVVVGTWEGALDALGLTVRFHVTQTDDGRLASTLDVPEQGAVGMPTGSTTFEDGVLTIDVPAVGAVYTGTLGEDGTVTGELVQGGAALPLVLRRVTGAERPRAGRADEPRGPFPYREEEVSVPSAEGVTLAGTLSVPDGPGPYPAVVLVTGSGPQNRDQELLGHRPFHVLADHLARRGVAVLRYDDRGVGGSSGDFDAATTADFARDAQAAAEYLAARPESASVGVLGHSEGGLVGPMAAAASDAVAFVVSLAGPAVPFRDVLRYQLGGDTEAGRAALDAFLDEAATGDPATAPERAAAAYTARLGADGGGLGADEVVGLADVLAGPWGRYLLAHDPTAAPRALRVPALAVFAARDRQVRASDNVPAAVDALAGAPPGSRVVVLPDLNHLFQPTETGDPAEYATTDTSFDPAMMDLVADWILAR